MFVVTVGHGPEVFETIKEPLDFVAALIFLAVIIWWIYPVGTWRDDRLLVLLGQGLADGVAVVPAIAAQLRAMKRLWIGKNLDGLLSRREAEARLIEESGDASIA